MTQTAGKDNYFCGFGNAHATEAVAGTLPEGRNSPQKVAHGLFAEQLSGAAFTAPRAENRHSWLYRIIPTASHKAYKRIDNGMLRSTPFEELKEVTPNRLRWDPVPLPSRPTDFIDGLVTMAGNGDVDSGSGVGIHVYACNQSMKNRVFMNADGELLFVPEHGAITLRTELGVLDIVPGEIAVVPRGMRFRVELGENAARGYLLENYGAMLRLPELGPIGSNGLANSRDFLTPNAWFEDKA
ncbi:MAG: homogentisate 1,2-dioxygenase, partial [Alphaproteobacteria bacterium]